MAIFLFVSKLQFQIYRVQFHVFLNKQFQNWNCPTILELGLPINSGIESSTSSILNDHPIRCTLHLPTMTRAPLLIVVTYSMVFFQWTFCSNVAWMLHGWNMFSESCIFEVIHIDFDTDVLCLGYNYKTGLCHPMKSSV